jgi:hypothetical protein
VRRSISAKGSVSGANFRYFALSFDGSKLCTEFTVCYSSAHLQQDAEYGL